MQPTQSHADYYRARAVQERLAADRASDPLVQRLHDEMARHYESFARPDSVTAGRTDEAA